MYCLKENAHKCIYMHICPPRDRTLLIFWHTPIVSTISSASKCSRTKTMPAKRVSGRGRERGRREENGKRGGEGEGEGVVHKERRRQDGTGVGSRKKN
jgi:hypothetical protein